MLKPFFLNQHLLYTTVRVDIHRYATKPNVTIFRKVQSILWIEINVNSHFQHLVESKVIKSNQNLIYLIENICCDHIPPYIISNYLPTTFVTVAYLAFYAPCASSMTVMKNHSWPIQFSGMCLGIFWARKLPKCCTDWYFSNENNRPLEMYKSYLTIPHNPVLHLLK